MYQQQTPNMAAGLSQYIFHVYFTLMRIRHDHVHRLLHIHPCCMLLLDVSFSTKLTLREQKQRPFAASLSYLMIPFNWPNTNVLNRCSDSVPCLIRLTKTLIYLYSMQHSVLKSELNNWTLSCILLRFTNVVEKRHELIGQIFFRNSSRCLWHSLS